MLYTLVWFVMLDCIDYCLWAILDILNLCEGSSVDQFSSFLFLICSSVSRKEILVSKIFYSSSIELGFVFNSPKLRISCSLLPVHKNNISSMKPKELHEIPCKNRDIYFLSKWSINILSYDSAEILSMEQPFIFVELQLNKKSFNARIDYGKVVITFVTIAFLGKLSSYAFAAFILSLII